MVDNGPGCSIRIELQHRKMVFEPVIFIFDKNKKYGFKAKFSVNPNLWTIGFQKNTGFERSDDQIEIIMGDQAGSYLDFYFNHWYGQFPGSPVGLPGNFLFIRIISEGIFSQPDPRETGRLTSGW